MLMDGFGNANKIIIALACGSFRSLWPQPTGKVALSQELELIDIRDLQIVINAQGDAVQYLDKVSDYFKELLNMEKTNCDIEAKKLKIVLISTSSDVNLLWKTDESYSLKIETDNEIKATITGPTVFGVRHGLETLSQLVTKYKISEQKSCLVTLKNGKINDTPAYAHRGLLIDTARNYQSLSTIKRHIDGMASSKMNVLHWHITDSQSFPLVSTRIPNMSNYGAYSEKQTYSPEDVKDLMDYALIRGVRVILELDAPAHVGSGWEWGPEAGLGNLGVCIHQQPWRSYCIQPPCGQLNPMNPNVYKVLELLYQDFVDLNPNADMFHMGGDEVFIPCWNSTNEITDSLKDRSEKAFLDLWASFQQKALDKYDKVRNNHKTNLILWTSHLTNPAYIESYLPKDRYIIQTWVPQEDELPKELLKLGYKLIISTKNKWYLDHGFWGTTPYYNWRAVYNNIILRGEGVLGGEVCMWGELVDNQNVLQRTWPRAAAAAERLWSDPSTTSEQAENRFFTHRDRLLFRGINAEAVVPKWCSQNEGKCNSYLP
ncbi:unnamed protein product [Brassicogethes aeneus]|uniref:Beta-hexosaminidase n=1 Tax=Brassicogethes aeneus TaxID=1431903 RepID=A0A9P0FBU1_BRAAE|nr:unnamed protein product [Brassicogethes aeneus]